MGETTVSMMRILILVAAAAAAFVAAMLVNGASNRAPDVIEVAEVIDEPLVPTVQVLVAANDLELGYRIAPDDLVWQPWPEDGLSDAFIMDDIDPEAITSIAGAVVRMPIFQGEPVSNRKIVQPGDAGFMAAVITEGMRAAAVEISVETAAGGFILPNDRVDVILTYQIDVTEGEIITQRPTTKTILENVRVLAIDQTFREIEGEDIVIGTSATLELEPRHAELLSLAQEMGEVSLTLRSVTDSNPDAPSVVSGNTSLSASAAETSTIRIYRQGNLSEANVGGSQ